MARKQEGAAVVNDVGGWDPWSPEGRPEYAAGDDTIGRFDPWKLIQTKTLKAATADGTDESGMAALQKYLPIHDADLLRELKKFGITKLGLDDSRFSMLHGIEPDDLDAPVVKFIDKMLRGLEELDRIGGKGSQSRAMGIVRTMLGTELQLIANKAKETAKIAAAIKRESGQAVDGEDDDAGYQEQKVPVFMSLSDRPEPTDAQADAIVDRLFRHPRSKGGE